MNTVLRSASVLALAASALSASAGSLSTLFAANNDGDSLWTNFFDVTALASPLSITSLGLNIAQDSATSTPGLAFSVGIYTKSGTYSGSEANAGVWTLRATGTGTTAALNSPSAATFSAFTIPVGTSGFAIRYTVPSNSLVGPVYTNGTGTNTSYANADLTIVAGSSEASTAAPFSGTLFTPRVWNGTINYSVTPTPEPSAFAALGLGAMAVLRRRKRA